jgi:GNAT superfamily N-acetyltransferase
MGGDMGERSNPLASWMSVARTRRIGRDDTASGTTLAQSAYHGPMAGETIIRTAEQRDSDAVGRLGAGLMRLHYGYDPDRFLEPPREAEAGYARFLGSQIGAKDAVVLVAERDGEVIGYAYAGLEPMSWMELRGPAGFIHDVVVSEDARGAGVGALLVERAAAWLESHGAPRIMLWTAEKNATAQRLFARLGFRRTMIEMTREPKGRPKG